MKNSKDYVINRRLFLWYFLCTHVGVANYQEIGMLAGIVADLDSEFLALFCNDGM